MRLIRIFALLSLGALLLTLPAYADTWTVFPTPGSGAYLPSTINYGGGDGSGGTINSLGPFSFSSGMVELSVPNSWATWNCPPATESCTPNVLYSSGATALTILTSDVENTIGFELEPDLFQAETVQATFTSSTGMTYTLTLTPSGSAGALLFAVQDDTLGAHIVSVDIVDLAGDDFAIANLRTGNSIPEPGTLALLGTGLLGAIGAFRRKLNL